MSGLQENSPGSGAPDSEFSKEEFRALPARLLALGFQATGQVFMTDTFLPVSKEGDMMRLRVETMNDITKQILTRKKWVEIRGEREREEEEKVTSELAAGCLLELGERLAGSPVAFLQQRPRLVQSSC